MNDPSALVGSNIRRLRSAQGLSLSALARRSKVAKATLSSLEAGSGNPTVSTLTALGAALRVPVRDLLVEREGPPSHVLRAGDAERPGTDDVPIDAFVPHGAVEVYDLRYEQGMRIEYTPHGSGTTERVLVYEGVLKVGPAEAPTELHPGDYISFAADRAHVFEAVEGKVRAALIVSYLGGVPAESPLHEVSRR